MLTDNEIQQALHAARVVPLSVPNPHGPLGLEQLAAAVAHLSCALPQDPRIRRPISLSPATWQKLDQLALATPDNGARRATASEVATAIIEQFVATLPATPR